MITGRRCAGAAALIALVALAAGCQLETTSPADLLTATAEVMAHDVGTAVAATQGLQGAAATGEAMAATPAATGLPTPALPNSVGPYKFPETINPLTGLPVDPALLDRRPVAVKINNYPRSNRPQWGLAHADIVWEYYHNNDLPRFHAIFYSTDVERAGPIRSGRPFDDFLLRMYGSHFAFGSADQRILNLFLAAPYADRLVYLLGAPDCPAQPMCRYDPTGGYYLVADTQGLREFNLQTGGDDERPDLAGMWFSTSEQAGAEAVDKLYIRWSYGAYMYWDYDPTSGRYVRYQDIQEDIGGHGEAYAVLTDGLNGAAVEADNVVVLLIPHLHRVYIPSDGVSPRVEIVDMDFIGEGSGYALRDGRIYEVRWVRTATSGPLTLLLPDGTLYAMKPGQTWYEVVTPESAMSSGDDWLRFDFKLSFPDEELREWQGER